MLLWGCTFKTALCTCIGCGLLQLDLKIPLIAQNVILKYEINIVFFFHSSWLMVFPASLAFPTHLFRKKRSAVIVGNNLPVIDFAVHLHP